MSSATDPSATLWLEDLAPGQCLPLGAILCSSSAVDGYAAATGDDHAIHCDSNAARRLGFPDRIAQGPLPLGFVLSALARCLGPSVRTLLSIDNWTFGGPAVVDVPLDSHVSVASVGDKGRSSAPVTFAIQLADAAGKIVQSGSVTLLVFRRPHEAAVER